MIKNKSFIVLLYLIFSILLGYSQGQIIGKVTNSQLTEISGITTYSQQPGYFWVHNDSGDKAQIYLIDSLGSLITTVVLKDVNVIDCEDISRTTINGKSYLLLADIGDNLRKREKLSIYLIPEPKVELPINNIVIDNEDIKVLNYTYADKKRDAEAIFVDPTDNEVYIVSKRDFHATVFSFPIENFYLNKEMVLRPKLELPFTFVTAADMSFDGKYILIKNISHIFMWSRNENEPVLKTLSKPYQLIPYKIEPQGEAICFDPYEKYFYTVTERPFGLDAYIYRYSF